MTFAGLKIVFSSVIPLDVPPETTDIWRTAVAFGAECYRDLNLRITHVVANKVCCCHNVLRVHRGLMAFLLLFLAEGYGEGRPSSATSANDKPINKGSLARVVQRLFSTLDAAR